ncbi:helix-turn-helix transcriptional regulator [Leucobacter chironomi]|uniref:helix-turn-helix transcriptional regulator n=1 Tax=Leucobacter chironomi TaxID=491918 RepID=UPI0009755153|nr:hypothetical protein [Leucobacter chironomi]
MTTALTPEYITPAQVCELIPGMTKAKLAQLRLVESKGPRFYKPTDRTVCYERGEVLAWIAGSAMTGTAVRK